MRQGLGFTGLGVPRAYYGAEGLGPNGYRIYGSRA